MTAWASSSQAGSAASAARPSSWRRLSGYYTVTVTAAAPGPDAAAAVHTLWLSGRRPHRRAARGGRGSSVSPAGLANVFRVMAAARVAGAVAE